ncbi:MAG TPA: sigma-70 family RNA polymerase sigma factor [Solirubrobacterales bacterium]|nr:sigma-70 family RNA polymerase sigma factor [Solirubrobacterales bacterium]
MSEAAIPGLSGLLTDDRLTRRAVRGDERAFAAIFRRYHQSLYRFCLAIVGNPEDAQDALQNTMIKVLRALPGEDRKIELRPWLYRIAHNESIDLLRRRRETPRLDVEQIAPGYGLAEDVATRERLRRLLADLKELPERQREVLVMRELSGLDFEEIGAALDTSGAVARQTLYEARQSLHQMEEGREMSCAAVTEALSDGDGRVTRRRDIRAHLRSCGACRAFRDDIKSRQRDLAALSPLPAFAAAGMLHGLLGGSQGAAGGGLAATLGGGAAKTIGASAVAKGVATAAVVAAIGVTTADQTGVIHLGLPGERNARSSQAAPGAGSSASGQAVSGVDAPAAPRGQGNAGGTHPGSAVAGGSKGAAKQGVSVAPAPAATGAEHRAVPAEGNGNAQAPGRGNADAKGSPAEHAQGQGQDGAPAAANGGQETAVDHRSPQAEPKSPPQEPGAGGSEAPAHPTAPAQPAHPSAPAPAPSPLAPPEEAPANPSAAAPDHQAPASPSGPPPGTPGAGKADEKRP